MSSIPPPPGPESGESSAEETERAVCTASAKPRTTAAGPAGL